jgi:diguanylate cyclase (GGDEF)-like protein
MNDTSGAAPGEAVAGHGENSPIPPASVGSAPSPASRLVRHSEILDLIVQNAPLPEILAFIASVVEREIPDALASILLLDEEGLRVRVGAGLSLPAEYNAAIEGALIGPSAGTCGTAAYHKRVVITPDIALDPAWDEWRAAAEPHGLVACWSTPFLGLHDRVLGTFAVYFTEPRSPTPDELALLHDAGYLTAVAIQHDTVRQLLHDTSRTSPSTGLPNRVVFEEQLEIAERRAAKSDRRFSVIKVSVGEMAPINDAFGASVGDEVLRTAGSRLAALVDEPDLAAHVWGCDFVVLLTDLASNAEAQQVAEHIADVLSDPFHVEGMALTVSVNLGVASYGPEVLNTPRPLDEPLRSASIALEQARQAGGTPIGIYDPDADPGARAAVLVPALRRGLETEEFTLAYQPVVVLADESIERYEALLRWSSPQGNVAPDAFVPVAEHSGLVTDLGRYALDRALAELAVQRAAGRDVGISVNLSVRQLSDTELPEHIAELIKTYDVPAEKVTLEVTEGVLISTTGKSWSVLDRIQALGTRISLDDFGSGFSQLGYLRRFEFDEIKLDRTLIREMDDNRTALAIVKGAVTFAATAELPIVAEGIETAQQRDRLRDLGCTHGQGYLFGTPRPTASPA